MASQTSIIPLSQLHEGFAEVRPYIQQSKKEFSTPLISEMEWVTKDSEDAEMMTSPELE